MYLKCWLVSSVFIISWLTLGSSLMGEACSSEQKFSCPSFLSLSCCHLKYSPFSSPSLSFHCHQSNLSLSLSLSPSSAFSSPSSPSSTSSSFSPPGSPSLSLSPPSSSLSCRHRNSFYCKFLHGCHVSLWIRLRSRSENTQYLYWNIYVFIYINISFSITWTSLSYEFQTQL